MSQEEFKSTVWEILSTLAFWYFIAIIAVSIANKCIGKYTDIGRDDTDQPGGRSDMVVLTDHQTGCQYLMGAHGGLTPRLDADGKHICNKRKGGGAV